MARRRRLIPAQPGYTLEQEEGAQGAKAAPTPGLIAGAARVAPIAQVSGQSAEASALREMAEGIQAARDEGRMIIDVPLSDVSPGHLLRDRVGLDREELDMLKASIRAHGQRTPAEIAPLADPQEEDPRDAQVCRFGLISGWRRLTALNELYQESGDPKFSTLRAVIRQLDDGAESYVAMIEENEIRVGLSYYERARVVAGLTQRGVFPDQSTALKTLFANASRSKRSKIGSFVELVEALDGKVRFPADIPERLGLAVVARLRQASGTQRAKLIQNLAEADNAAAEQGVLTQFCRAGGRAPRSGAAMERIAPDLDMRIDRKGQKITVTLEGAGADDTLLEQLRGMLRKLPD